MARALYREWFVNFRFPGHVRPPRPVPPGEIPQWEGDSLTDGRPGWRNETATPLTFCRAAGGYIRLFQIRDYEDADKHLTELGLSECASPLYPPDTSSSPPEGQ